MSTINIKKIKPMFTALITTMDKYTEDVKTNGLIDVNKQQGALKEYQKVVAVGGLVRDIKVGDMVCINPKQYAKKKYNEGSLKNGVISENATIGYNFNVVEMDGQKYLLLQDRDIDFIIEEYEEIEDTPPSKLIIPDKSIIASC